MYRRRYSAFESSAPRIGVLPPSAIAAAAGVSQQAASKLSHNNNKLSVRFDPNLPDNDSDSNNNNSNYGKSENIVGYDSLHAKVARKARSLSNSPLYRKKRYSHLPTLMSSNGPTASANYQLLNNATITDIIDGQHHTKHVSRRDDSIGISNSNNNSGNNSNKIKQKDGKKLSATLSAAMPAVLLRRSSKQQKQQQKEQQQQQQLQQQQQQHQQQQQQMSLPPRNNNSKNIANGLVPGKRLSVVHSPATAPSELAATGLQQSLVYQRRSSHSAHNSPRHSSPAPVHQCLLLRRRSDYSVEQIEQWKRQQQHAGRKISVSL